jgi:SAM-dependent methyltransferase
MATPSELDPVKLRSKMVWGSGDFGKIARYAEVAAAKFVAEIPDLAGARVLDLACGTGNSAIPAARAGAQVTGVDLVPQLLDQARERAAREHLDAHFEEGDAEQLRFPDASFDVLITMFGAMFAPHPERVASELLRVVRPSGRIIMANWTPEGFAGRMFATTAKHVPPPPGLQPPTLWGREDVVRERLAGAERIEFQRRNALFDFDLPPSGVVRLFRTYFGPTLHTFAALDEQGQKALQHDLEQLWSSLNEADDPTQHTFVKGEYLQVTAHR